MKGWYLKNLFGGLRLALFLPCEREHFIISWHALVSIILSIIFIHFAIDNTINGKAGELNYYGWHRYHTGMYTLVFFFSYLVAAMFSQTEKALNIAVMFYNSFLFVLIPYFFLYSINPVWRSENIDQSLNNIILIWTFLVMFRIIGLNFPPSIKCQTFGSIFAVSAIYLLNSHVYISYFYYPAYDESEEEQKPPSAYESLTDEEVFLRQPDLLDMAFKTLKPAKKGTTEMYGISFGSYSHQDVFMREAKYVTERMETILSMDKKVVTMINNPDSFFQYPLASSSNLLHTLKHIGSIIQPEEDIVFIYLTSHGSAEYGLSVNMKGRGLLGIDAERLARILKNSGIKYKVIIISACYSGSMIDSIKDENSLIMTAAASDKTSFGCSDTADLTYFADAYFKQALAETNNLEKAFYKAKEYVEAREDAENIKPNSNPQIFIGKNISKLLKKYEKTVPVKNKSQKSN